MIYLASPYTHNNPLIRQKRFEQVSLALAIFLLKGEAIYSPIVQCHTIAIRYNLPKDFDFWMKYNLSILTRSDELRILKLSGWQKSVGIQTEEEFATLKNIFISYTNFKDLLLKESELCIRLMRESEYLKMVG